MLDRFIGKKNSEKTYTENGYVIGINSHIIYHVPSNPINSTYILPNGSAGLSEDAIGEMAHAQPQKIVVPGSFKTFRGTFRVFRNLKYIELQEGIEEINCSFNENHTINIKYPSTIKKIAAHNYSLTPEKHLIIPEGVVEIAPFFATHDTNLLSATIPGSIKTIPKFAFNQCKNLQKLTINEGVEKSENDFVRGTNNLLLLRIPSSYNGTIDLSMDSRSCGEYDGKNFEIEMNNIVKIIIRRENKSFEFNIKRGEMPQIYIRQNTISIKCKSQEQAISLNCESLEQGIYNIENGIIKKQEPLQSKTQINVSQPQEKNQQMSPQELESIFRNAIEEQLLPEDFEDLSDADREKVISLMRERFMNAARLGTIRTDPNFINRLFTQALTSLAQDNLNNGGYGR